MIAPVLSRCVVVRRGMRKGTTRLGRSGPIAWPSPALPNHAQPRPPLHPQSQFLSQSYESILPTSLIYILLLTRDFSSWRPVAVISTARGNHDAAVWIFTGRRACTGQPQNWAALLLHAPLSLCKRLPGAPLPPKRR